METVRPFYLPPVDYPKPQQVLETFKGGTWWYVYELPHNCYACDEDSKCNSSVFKSFKWGARGEELSMCRGCYQEVIVDLTKLTFTERLA